MTVEERLECGTIYARFKNGEWREGTVEELEKDYPFTAGYINLFNTYQKKNTKVAIFKSETNEKTYILYMFTENRNYSINITPDYLGAFRSNRREEPLEDWHRGRDLPDGKPNDKTWQLILFSIIASELVPFDDGSKKPEPILETSSLGGCLGGVN